MYPYVPETTMATESAGSLAVLLITFLVYFISISISIASYIMSSLSFYTISKKRNIKNPWIAWIPIANIWNIGSVADGFDADRGIKRKWRTVLLTFTIIMIASAVVFSVIIAGFGIATVASAAAYDGDILASEFGGVFVGFMIALYVGTIIITMVAMAFEFLYYICIYKVFEATVPTKAVKYIILSLLVPLAEPILLLVASKACPEKIVPTAEIPQNSFGEQL